MLCYPKIRSECQNHCVKISQDQTISLKIINEKQGYATSEIYSKFKTLIVFEEHKNRNIGFTFCCLFI